MKSIRPRFLFISAIIISIALTAATFGFILIFERNVERRINAELTDWGNRIAANLSFGSDGKLLLPDGLSDTRFEVAYGGLYWQIDDPGRGEQIRSRSLWDFVIDLPEDQHDAGTIHVYTLPGPDNTLLYVQERALVVATPVGARTIRISVAIDRAALTLARDQFVRDIIPYIIFLGVLLLLASAFQLSLGLRPLSKVSRDLKRMEKTPEKRLVGDYPAEISQLVDAVNSLLDTKEKTINKSRSRAADLAHGLKTPLTVLANNAHKLREAGNAKMAAEIEGLCTAMQNHVNYELARSRIAYGSEIGVATADFKKLLGEIQRTLAKTPKGEGIVWQNEGGMDVTVKLDPHDLRELLGNILENAVKWSRKTVIIRTSVHAGVLKVRVEDDGPGIQSDKISEMTGRGKRFDENISGTGFGLSIVQDIVENYDLAFSIQNRQGDGLCVSVDLPVADFAGNED